MSSVPIVDFYSTVYSVISGPIGPFLGAVTGAMISVAGALVATHYNENLGNREKQKKLLSSLGVELAINQKLARYNLGNITAECLGNKAVDNKDSTTVAEKPPYHPLRGKKLKDTYIEELLREDLAPDGWDESDLDEVRKIYLNINDINVDIDFISDIKSSIKDESYSDINHYKKLLKIGEDNIKDLQHDIEALSKKNLKGLGEFTTQWRKVGFDIYDKKEDEASIPAALLKDI
jgi:hypothetical protein